MLLLIYMQMVLMEATAEREEKIIGRMIVVQTLAIVVRSKHFRLREVAEQALVEALAVALC